MLYLFGLERARHVNDHDMAMRSELGVGSQLPRADLEPQFRRRPSAIGATLADTSRASANDPMSEKTAARACPTLRLAPRHSRSRVYPSVSSGLSRISASR